MGFNDRNFGGQREMHEVTCSECGQKCEVPFKPREGKPVYCSKCFGKEPKGKSADLSIINQKLDKIMKALGIDE